MVDFECYDSEHLLQRPNLADVVDLDGRFFRLILLANCLLEGVHNEASQREAAQGTILLNMLGVLYESQVGLNIEAGNMLAVGSSPRVGHFLLGETIGKGKLNSIDLDERLLGILLSFWELALGDSFYKFERINIALVLVESV